MKRVSGRKQNNKIAPIKPKIPEEPPLDVMCICPHCDQQFTPLEMHGTYLNRLCPVCNSEGITEKEVNQEAVRLIGLYGDLNQNRGIMHAWRIKKLENERKAHSRYELTNQTYMKKLMIGYEDVLQGRESDASDAFARICAKNG